MGIVIGEVRLSYCHLTEVDKNGKYSVTCLLPKTNEEAIAALQQAIEEAKDLGQTKKWQGKMPAKVHVGIHDGDGNKENGEPYGEECKGCYVFTVSSKDKPQVVDMSKKLIADDSEIYSGMYAKVYVNAAPYVYNGKSGVGLYLGPVQKTRDGEPFGGSTPSAASVFGMPDEPDAASVFG